MNERELKNAVLSVENILKNRIKNMRNNPKRNVEFENGMYFALNLVQPYADKIRKAEQANDKKYKAPVTDYKQPYNIHCFHYQELDGNPICAIKMDMCFCGQDCAYSTTQRKRLRH